MLCFRADEKRLRAAPADLSQVPSDPLAAEEATQIRAGLARIAQTFRALGTSHQRREIVRQYIVRVEILPDEVVLFYEPKESPYK